MKVFVRVNTSLFSDTVTKKMRPGPVMIAKPLLSMASVSLAEERKEATVSCVSASGLSGPRPHQEKDWNWCLGGGWKSLQGVGPFNSSLLSRDGLGAQEQPQRSTTMDGILP